MSKRNRHDRGLLVLALLLAAVVLIAFFGLLEQAQRNTYREPTEQSASAVDEKDWWKDTLPQWLMAVFAIAATGVGVWTILLLRDTVAATRKSNRIARKSAERQLRAYVQTDCGGVTVDSEKLVASLRMRNSGQTPAYRIAFKSHIFISPTLTAAGEEHIWRTVNEQPLEQTDAAIGAGASHRQTIESRATSDKVKGLFLAAASGQAPVIIAGRITYFDAFDRSHWTEFFHFYAAGNLKEGQLYIRGNNST